MPPSLKAPALTSWGSILDPAQAATYKGTIFGLHDPIYIADAAVNLKAHDLILGITNLHEPDS